MPNVRRDERLGLQIHILRRSATTRAWVIPLRRADTAQNNSIHVAINSHKVARSKAVVEMLQDLVGRV